MFFQAALCSVTCPHRLLYSVFSSEQMCLVKTYNAKWESSYWKGRIHHIMPIAADSGRGLGAFNPPPLQCVAVRKRGSYWSPLPLLSSPDFSALNGVLHYTLYCSWFSPVQGLNCMHGGWHCTVHYTSCCHACACSFCNMHFVRFATFAAALQMIHNHDHTCGRTFEFCISQHFLELCMTRIYFDTL